MKKIIAMSLSLILMAGVITGCGAEPGEKATLKQLETDGLIIRTEYPQIPPKVEYRLSERGKSLMPILDQMCEWGDQNRQ